jgi:hypothetical protein
MVYLFFCSFSFDLLLEEIFGTEEVLEYILSDSSEEEEDATPEQRVNHQLRRRIRHLEHNLRDITARCNAERERRMSLQVLVGGKTIVFYLTPVLNLKSSPNNYSLLQISLTDTVT